jgi:tRNA nucleotidyltransferase (CCA-adding enzyme)
MIFDHIKSHKPFPTYTIFNYNLKVMNIKHSIKSSLPSNIYASLKLLGEVAANSNDALYIIGGAARDFIIDLPIHDLDLVLVGDINIFSKSAESLGIGRIVSRSQFRTIKFELDNIIIDIASARTEKYESPGSLPIVEPAELQDDLLRRDFKLNTLAVSINPETFGEVTDMLGGLDSIHKKLITGLHEKTFQDDPTRIIRGAIYKTRFQYTFDAKTLDWIKRDIRFLTSVSTDRLKQEFNNLWTEDNPELVLKELSSLGASSFLPIRFAYSNRIDDAFMVLREHFSPNTDLYPFILFGLNLSLNNQSTSQVPSGAGYQTKIVADISKLKNTMEEGSYSDFLYTLAPSKLCDIFREYDDSALIVTSCINGNINLIDLVKSYLDNYKNQTPFLNGKDLLLLGIPEGPQIGELLKLSTDLKLDGKITSVQDEIDFIKKWALNSSD